MLPEIELLEKILEYDPSSGSLTFKKREPEMFKPSKTRGVGHQCNLFNSRLAGKSAGSKSSDGYVSLKINLKTYKAHRIIWKMMTGIEPKFIDHINRDTSDNRWENLRDVTHAENCRNRKIQANSSTGVRGVFPRPGGYRAVIQKDGKRISLGNYPSVDMAKAARKSAEFEISFSQLGELK